MGVSTKIENFLKHSIWDTIATFIKKFKSSKSYWSVSFIVIVFTLREAIAWKYGSAISAYSQKQLEGSDWVWLWTAIEFVFDIGGSWELVLLGISCFIILSYVKVNSAEKDEIVKVVKDESSKTRDDLDAIKALIKQHGTSETDFLEKYFGKDYAVILQNPQTYHNFTTLLKQTEKTADELLKEREELLNKIKKQSFSDKLQNQIDKAFKELRYEDVRELIDGFLRANADKEKDIIKAHYIKALSFMEQIRYQEAKDEFEKIAPNIDDAEILNDYARIYDILGEYDKAIEYYEKSLKIYLDTLGEKHLSTSAIYNNIGSVWNSKGKYDKALEYYEKDLKIILATIGENHPDTATSYNNIGLAWKSKGEYDKAIEYYEKSLKIRLATLGENHPNTATSYNNIGLVWQDKGEYNKAIDYHKKSLNIKLTTLGNNHPDTAASYNNLGLTWNSKGEYNKAIRYYEKALQIARNTLGKEHPHVAMCYSNIGVAWYSKGEYNKAIDYHKKSLNIRLATLGENHPDTATSYNNIGSACQTKGEYDKAIEYYEKALHILRSIFPNGHPYIDITTKSLNSAKESLKDETN